MIKGEAISLFYPFVLSALRVSVWKEHWTSGAVLLSQLCLDLVHSFIFSFLLCKIKKLGMLS